MAVVGFLPRIFVTPFTFQVGLPIISKEMCGEMIRLVIRRTAFVKAGNHQVANE
jgi:hypothetical protein